MSRMPVYFQKRPHVRALQGVDEMLIRAGSFEFEVMRWSVYVRFSNNALYWDRLHGLVIDWQHDPQLH